METYSEQRGPQWHRHGVAPSIRCAVLHGNLLAAATGWPGGSGVGGSAAVNNDYARGKAGDDDDGNAPTAMVSNFCWRALDVSTEDITIARDEMRKECTWEGEGDARKSTHF